MNDFSLFDLLPNGLLVFENKKIEYINQHILDILNIGYLNKKSSIDVMLRTMSISKEEDLFHFFIKHNYFIHNGKVVQIEHTRYDELDIFSFMLIDPSLVKTESLKNAKKSRKINIDKKVAEHFELNNIRKVGVLTFYKGLPLKNIGQVLRINSDSIEIMVDPKHKISLLERDDIILIMNKKSNVSALHGYVEKSNENVFTVKNFTLTKDDMHLRRSVRIKPELDMFVKIDKKELPVYDISEKGISIKVHNKEDEELLKKYKSMDLFFHDYKLHINVEYLKTVWDDSGDIVKIIFLMYNTGDTASNIHNYVVARQNEIIKEIHMYRKKRKVID